MQIRGSIPLEWTQKPTMKYTPAIHISDVRIFAIAMIIRILTLLTITLIS